MRLNALFIAVAFAALFLTTRGQEPADAIQEPSMQTVQPPSLQSEPTNPPELLEARGTKGHNAYSVLSSALSKQRGHGSQPKPTPHSKKFTPHPAIAPSAKLNPKYKGFGTPSHKTYWTTGGSTNHLGGLRAHHFKSIPCLKRSPTHCAK